MRAKTLVAATIFVLAQVNWTLCQNQMPPWVTTITPVEGQTYLHLPSGKAIPYLACYTIRDNTVKNLPFQVDMGNGNIVPFLCSDILRLDNPSTIILDSYTVTSDLFQEVVINDPRELFVELPNGVLLSYDLLCKQATYQNPRFALPELPILPDVDLDAILSADATPLKVEVKPTPNVSILPTKAEVKPTPNVSILTAPGTLPATPLGSQLPLVKSYENYQSPVTMSYPSFPYAYQHYVSQPSSPQHYASQPCPSHPCSPHPCPAEPCSPQPCPSHPCSPHPCPSEPCSPQPCPSQPCLTQPCPTQPCAPQPCALNPCGPESCSTDHGSPCSPPEIFLYDHYGHPPVSCTPLPAPIPYRKDCTHQPCLTSPYASKLSPSPCFTSPGYNCPFNGQMYPNIVYCV